MKSYAGSTMLLVVLLMSVVLVLCTRMWRTTAYVVDIAVKKQEAVQHKWAAQGILQCGVAACRANFNNVYQKVQEQGGSITVPLHSYTFSIPQLKNSTSTITFATHDGTSLHLMAALRSGGKIVCEKTCVVYHSA